MKITDKETIRRLEELNARLQRRGFSFQLDDYFLLQDYLPEIIKILKDVQDEEITRKK